MEVDTKHGIPKIIDTIGVEFGIGSTQYMAQSKIVVAAGAMMYKYWRVVAFGFQCFQAGFTGQDPKVQFSLYKSDAGPPGYGYWGTVTQDTTAGKQFAVGDMFLHDPLNFCKAPLPLENGGTPTVDTTDKFMEWQHLGALLAVVRPNDHQLGVMPFMCVEMKK